MSTVTDLKRNGYVHISPVTSFICKFWMLIAFWIIFLLRVPWGFMSFVLHVCRKKRNLFVKLSSNRCVVGGLLLKLPFILLCQPSNELVVLFLSERTPRFYKVIFHLISVHVYYKPMHIFILQSHFLKLVFI